MQSGSSRLMTANRDDITDRTLLLIEDNPGDVFLARELLRGSEFSVEVAPTLAAGIEAFERSPRDLVLLDLGLPGSRGEETYFRFREVCPQATTIIWSDLDDSQIAKRLVGTGKAASFLVKTYQTFASGESFLHACRNAIAAA